MNIDTEIVWREDPRAKGAFFADWFGLRIFLTPSLRLVVGAFEPLQGRFGFRDMNEAKLFSECALRLWAAFARKNGINGIMTIEEIEDHAERDEGSPDVRVDEARGDGEGQGRPHRAVADGEVPRHGEEAEAERPLK